MTHPVRDSLVLRSPDALVASLPHLLGFWPRDSVVAVWISAGRVHLTQRLDLAAWTVDRDDLLGALWNHPAARAADDVIFVVVTTTPPAADLIEALRLKTTQQHVFMRDLLIAGDGTWRSALCGDESCCPAAGRPIDPVTFAEVNAEFAVLGSAPMADRSSVVDSARREAVAVARIAGVLESFDNRVAEDGKDVSIGMVLNVVKQESTRIPRTAAIDDATAAAVMVALSDIRVRDTVLWELCRVDQPTLQAALTTLWPLLRLAPDDFVAPVGTACSIVAWLLGDGVRANVAIERALTADPGYTLGQLIAHALRGGMPPTVWRDAMTSVTRDECRHGLRASAPASS